MSRQKELIYSILKSSDGHLTASEIYRYARCSISNISLGTVYRDLNELYEDSRIGKFIPLDGMTVYDITPSAHGHMRCVICGKISDLNEPEMLKSVFDSVPGTIESANITIDYICSGCAENP